MQESIRPDYEEFDGLTVRIAPWWVRVIAQLGGCNLCTLALAVVLMSGVARDWQSTLVLVVGMLVAAVASELIGRYRFATTEKYAGESAPEP